MESNIIIRNAKIEDAKEILNIYKHYVEHTAITFECETPSLEVFENRMRNVMQKYPYLVVESEEGILGYSYASLFYGRAAFEWSAETTIYLSVDKKKRGVGRLLYEALETALKEMGILNLYACIAYPEVDDEYLDTNSADFHGHMGFYEVGRFRQCGYKFGRWYHMIWMEKVIGEHKVPQEKIRYYKGE